MSDEQPQYKYPRDHLRFDPRQYAPDFADSLTEEELTSLIDEAALVCFRGSRRPPEMSEMRSRTANSSV